MEHNYIKAIIISNHCRYVILELNLLMHFYLDKVKQTKLAFHLQSSTLPCCCLLQSCETKPVGLCRSFPNRAPVPRPKKTIKCWKIDSRLKILFIWSLVDSTACQISGYNNSSFHSPWWVLQFRLPFLSSPCCWRQTSTTWQHSWPWFCFFYATSFFN